MKLYSPFDRYCAAYWSLYGLLMNEIYILSACFTTVIVELNMKLSSESPQSEHTFNSKNLIIKPSFYGSVSPQNVKFTCLDILYMISYYCCNE